jgi:NAD+ kinase
MTDLDESQQPAGAAVELSCLGVIVHPARNVDEPVKALVDWARTEGAGVVQLPFVPDQRKLDLPQADTVEECSVVIGIGGDGTTLAAIRTAAAARRPVLGVACGSLGALTTVTAAEVGTALDRMAAGDWRERPVPALNVSAEGCADFVAFNDIVLVRGGEGQLKVAAWIDGALYTRLAGDGCVVSTPAGSGAYTIAAGGPLLVPELEAFTLTALPTHGGFSPPLVLSGRSRLELELTPGHGRGRLEVDGRLDKDMPTALTVAFTPHAATIVSFPDQQSYLSGLRQRGILMDSPRILADDKRRDRG